MFSDLETSLLTNEKLQPFKSYFSLNIQLETYI